MGTRLKLIPKIQKGWRLYSLLKNLPEQEYDYNYKVNYLNDPIDAWINFFKPHYSDAGKLPSHPTHSNQSKIHPELGGIWFNDKHYEIPDSKMFTDSDRTLDYVGNDEQDHDVKVTWRGGIVLPTLYVTPRISGFDMKENKYKTGFIYKDRK